MSKVRIQTHQAPPFDERLREVCAWVSGTTRSALYAGETHRVAVRSLEAFRALPPLTLERLFEARADLSHLEEGDIRHVSSQFNPEPLDMFFLVPLSRDVAWREAQEQLGRSPLPAVCATPMFWQMGPLFYAACRKRKVPAALVSPRNPDVTAEIVYQTDAEYVCGSADAIAGIYSSLHARNLHRGIRTWHMVVPVGTVVEPLPSGETIIEHQIFPGVLFGKEIGNGVVSISDDLWVEIARDGSVLVTTLSVPSALPLLRFLLPRVRAEWISVAERTCRIHYA